MQRDNCKTACGTCKIGCDKFEEECCVEAARSPYACNRCDKERRYKYSRYVYDAEYVQKQYEQTLSQACQGISLSEEEFTCLDKKVVRLVKNGISIPVICKENANAGFSTVTPCTPTKNQAVNGTMNS